MVIPITLCADYIPFLSYIHTAKKRVIIGFCKKIFPMVIVFRISRLTAAPPAFFAFFDGAAVVSYVAPRTFGVFRWLSRHGKRRNLRFRAQSEGCQVSDFVGRKSLSVASEGAT